MPDQPHPFGNFVNGRHAFDTGLIVGTLRTAWPGTTTEVERDADGQPTPDVTVAIGDEEYRISVHVVGVHDA